MRIFIMFCLFLLILGTQTYKHGNGRNDLLLRCDDAMYNFHSYDVDDFSSPRPLLHSGEKHHDGQERRLINELDYKFKIPHENDKGTHEYDNTPVVDNLDRVDQLQNNEEHQNKDDNEMNRITNTQNAKKKNSLHNSSKKKHDPITQNLARMVNTRRETNNKNIYRAKSNIKNVKVRGKAKNKKLLSGKCKLKRLNGKIASLCGKKRQETEKTEQYNDYFRFFNDDDKNDQYYDMYEEVDEYYGTYNEPADDPLYSDGAHDLDDSSAEGAAREKAPLPPPVGGIAHIGKIKSVFQSGVMQNNWNINQLKSVGDNNALNVHQLSGKKTKSRLCILNSYNEYCIGESTEPSSSEAQ